jgi:hypothetical protein
VLARGCGRRGRPLGGLDAVLGASESGHALRAQRRWIIEIDLPASCPAQPGLRISQRFEAIDMDRVEALPAGKIARHW